MPSPQQKQEQKLDNKQEFIQLPTQGPNVETIHLPKASPLNARLGN